jgi:3-oxo-5-alpha-steroid 4-dehydrogenase 1
LILETLYHYTLIASFALAGIVFVVLFFVNAPYGRHMRKGWGPMVSNRLSWLVMEAPSPLLMLVFFFLGSAPKNLVLVVFLLMWQAHYLHRAFIYPFMISDGQKKMPLVVMLMAFLFNLINGFLNGYFLFTFSGGYPRSWLWDLRFILGLIFFITGFVINRWADDILRSLRQPGERSYKIPFGMLYRWISCPNYFGEIIEWFGWAIATWSLSGLCFAIWTFVNLAPRARAHHTWYREHFPEYPAERKALIPGVW